MKKPIERRNIVRVVLGHKGFGKSYQVAKLVKGYARDFAVWDPVSDFAGNHAGNPIPRATLFPSARAHLAHVEKTGRVGRAIVQAPNTHFLPWLRAMLSARDCMIVVDEVSLFCSPSKLPPELAELVRIGRHRQIDQIYVSRRPAELHRDLTANVDELILFGIREPRDLEYIRKVAGDAFARAAQGLAPRRCVVYRGEHGASAPKPEQPT